MAALTLSTTLLPDAYVGEAYEASIAVQATCVASFALSAGTTQTGKNALPASLTYGTTGSHAGKIYGTPVPGDEGVYLLSVKVVDNGSVNSVDNQALTLNIRGSRTTIAALSESATSAVVSRLNM